MTVQRQLITSTGVQGFLQWLKTAQPYLYRKIEKKLPAPQLAGLGADDALIASASTAATPSSITDILKNLVLGAGQVLLTKEQLKAQQKILDLQLERARAGLAPADIDPTLFGLPAPSVRLGLDADVQRMLTVGAAVGGGLLLLYILFGSRRRRRR